MHIAVRDLKSRLSHYLVQAQGGEEILVTSHKKVIARIHGIPQSSNPAIQRLLDSGAVAWAGGKPQGGTTMPVIEGKSLSDMLIEDRG